MPLRFAALLTLCCAMLPVSAQADTFERPQLAVRNIYAKSDVLNSNSYHTVLPKGAVLFTPERFKSRVNTAPKGKFMLWPEFYAKNYGWIQKFQITEAHRKGTKQLTAEDLKRFSTSGKIVIAVRKNNPISVKKLTKTISSK